MPSNRRIRARLVGEQRRDGARLVVVRADTGERIRLDQDGRFELRVAAPASAQPDGDGGLVAVDGRPLPHADPVRLLLRYGTGSATEVVLDANRSEEVVIITPTPTTDPRRAVKATRERLSVEAQARKLARAALRTPMMSRIVSDRQLDSVLTAVLRDVGRHAGGDTRWRLPHGPETAESTALRDLTVRATEEARQQLSSAGVTIAAKAEALKTNQAMATSDLIRSAYGDQERMRRSTLDAIRTRRSMQNKDGLPVPLTGTRGGAAGGTGTPSPSASLRAAVDSKLLGMVDAMRLPEDPPLLQADSAVAGSGSEVEFAKGAADVTAFHDIHELALAMPSVWEEVFDRRFIDVLRDSLKELATAGVPLDVVAKVSDGSAARTVATMLRAVTAEYAETGARALHASRARTRPRNLDVAGTLIGPANGVLARKVKDGPAAPQIGGELAPEPEYPDPPRQPEEPDDPSTEEPPPETDRGPAGLLEELESFLRRGHSFTAFPAVGAQRSINFGVLLTWRQRWEPISYQTGDIVHTMTLAPGERRRIVTRRVQRLKRYTSEAKKSMQSRLFDTTDVTRAETEILRKADTTTNFELTAGGTTNLLVENGSFNTTTNRDVAKAGSETRRRFRESVLKAAQEYRDEHSLEVKTEEESSLEEETTSEVENRNDEIAATAVFYRLQRRYDVFEHLHRARPVVMVAMPVPNPADITSGWLVRHAWILERNLLAERFRAPLLYLTSSFLGDTEALDALAAAVADQKTALAVSQERLSLARALLESRGQSLQSVRQAIAEGEPATLSDRITGLPVVNLVADVYGFARGLFGGGDDESETRERNEMLLAAAEDELERAERESREAESQLTSATTSYQEAVRTYTEAKRMQRNHEVRIAELRAHVADNILHYMQALWSTEQPDQRFFSLHAVQIPDLTASVTLTSQPTGASMGVGGYTPEQFTLSFTQDNRPLTFRPLAEVAELDQLLGFKGNYAIFPLRSGNSLTDVILAPFLDADEVLRHPTDVASNWTIDELREYADHLREQVAAQTLTQDEFDKKHAPFLKATLEALITDPRPSVSTIVVPTDSLYVELLTSGGSLIEPFKREHRSLDVARVRAQIRELELENLRLTMRLMNNDLADPDMDDFERHLVRSDTIAGGTAPSDGGTTPPGGGG